MIRTAAMASAILYTVLLEYKCGTYISQVRSANPFDALKKWATELPDEDLGIWNLKRDELLSVIEADSLVSITNRVNVWCSSGFGADGEQLLLNVVATIDEQIEAILRG
jgi:hypothetical protein